MWDKRDLTVEIYDKEGSNLLLIATNKTQLALLLRNLSLDIPLHPSGTFHFTTELLPETDQKRLYLKLSGKNLREMDLIGKNDPYLIVTKVRGNEAIYTSEVLDDCEEPHWLPLSLNVPEEVEVMSDVRIEVFDKDFFGSDFIGSVTVTVHSLVELQGELELKDKEGEYSGTLTVDVAKLTDNYDFLRRIRDGLTFDITFVVDLGWGTGSYHSKSLSSNYFYRAIKSLAECLHPYTNTNFNLMSFGGNFLDSEEGQTYMRLTDREMTDVDSLLQGYLEAVSVCVVPSPRKVLSQLMREFRYTVCEERNRYSLLVVLTSGRFSDLEGMKEELRLLSAQPTTLLFICIGDVSQKEMSLLNSETALVASEGGTLLRDCVVCETYPRSGFPVALLDSLSDQLYSFFALQLGS